MTVTIKDVARDAGVSISTVSRVINDSKPVSPEARRKVLKAIERLGYQPNELARSLVMKKSNLIGVIVNDIGRGYSAQILRGIEEVGRMYKYDMLLSCSYGSVDQEIRLANLLKQKQVEGIIVISEIYNPQLLSYLKDIGIPHIYLNHDYVVKDIASVIINSFDASVLITEHLIENGHKNILFLHKKGSDNHSLDALKIKAFKETLSSKKLKSDFILSETEILDESENFSEKLVKYVKDNSISAVITSSDRSGIKLMRLLADYGLSVPEDVSVASYGNEEISGLYIPGLTSMDFPNYDIGAVSVRRILKSIENKREDSDLMLLPFRLIVRDSVKKLD